MVKAQLEEAWEEGIVVAAARNTFVDFAVFEKQVVRTSYVDRAQREKPQRRVNLTEECDTKSEDKGVATFVRLP